ncbi:hypothetical protein C1645_829202 [Glomus cerebriforme]|uniref:RNase H type-1 domain-containing protein n=1 Tax=Glomus cerebriforme TaxID=658196 RepID=A0A397SJV8_9GLOM|nr:hypothetical protein C1645_829202 [Glomus cerebriforme]
MSLALIQIHINVPYFEFSARIEHWPSSCHVEIAVIFIALIISPKNSNVTIFTDKNSNNLLWNLVINVVMFSSLNVNFIKVQAHSNNHFNTKVDQLAKSVNHINTLPLTFNYNFLPGINYLPLWKNIPIESNLRKFITTVARNCGFEKFIGLYRNKKYSSDVDWQLTFFSLNYEENTIETLFFTSNKKVHKIKFFIEELPTIEHIKKMKTRIYIDIIEKKIWKLRCNQFILDEFNAGIDRRSKLKKKSINSRSLSNTNLLSNIEFTLDGFYSGISA